MRQTGPIHVKAAFDSGEDVFTERRSFIFKRLHVSRFWDAPHKTFVYLVYSDKVLQGSPKNSISAVVAESWGTAGSGFGPLGNAARCARSVVMAHVVRNLTVADIDRAVAHYRGNPMPDPSLDDIGKIFRATAELSFRPELRNMAPCFVGVDIDGRLPIRRRLRNGRAFSAEVWELCWGSVATEYQARGIGDAMIKFRLAEIARRSTTKKTYVVVHTHPTALYLSNGFEKTVQMGIAGKISVDAGDCLIRFRADAGVW